MLALAAFFAGVFALAASVREAVFVKTITKRGQAQDTLISLGSSFLAMMTAFILLEHDGNIPAVLPLFVLVFALAAAYASLWSVHEICFARYEEYIFWQNSGQSLFKRPTLPHELPLPLLFLEPTFEEYCKKRDTDLKITQKK